LNMVLFPWNG